MVQQERERLLFGIGIAVALHAALFVIVAVVGFDLAPYPETRPVYVTLPDYEAAVLPDRERLDPEPQERPAQRVQEQISPAERAVTAETGSTRTETSQRSSEPPAPNSRSATADAPPGSFTTDDLRWLNESDSAARERERSSSDDLFAIEEPDAETTDLPSWVVEGEFSLQPESALQSEEQASLQDKRETVPGFAERLAELVNALQEPSSQRSDNQTQSSGRESAPSDSTAALPGGGAIEWVGSGSRSPVGDLALPRLTADDFYGQVPARISYLIVFEVNAEGLIEPGSLILRQSSGYTLADQKVRTALSGWRFDPAPGAPSVTAIATLHIARDEIR